MNKGIKTFGIASIVLSSILSGCMNIKDTSGIKKYLQDQGRAEILAVVIKDKNPDPNSTVYKQADALSVSIDYLLGREDTSKSLGPTAEQLFRDFENMSSEDQDTLTKFASMLAQKNKARNS